MSTSGQISNQRDAEASDTVPLSRLISWVLPLMLLSIAAGSLAMAVRAGQLPWINAGIVGYVVCIGMWAIAKLRKWIANSAVESNDAASAAAMPASATTMSASDGPAVVVNGDAEPKRAKPIDFYKFANLFLPSVACVALTACSYFAAITAQQTWLTTGMLCFAGIVIVWIGKLFVPLLAFLFLNQNASPKPSYGEPEPLRTRTYAAQLLSSFLALGTALIYASNAADMRWLAFAIGCFVLYLAIVCVQAMNFYTRGVGLEFTLIPPVGLGLLFLTLGWAMDLHLLSWIQAAVIGACGCATAWIIPGVAPVQKPVSVNDQRSVISNRTPAIAIAGLLVTLGLAFYGHEIHALQAIAIALFGGLAVWFSWMVFSAVQRDGAPQVESNWGGIGGGMGGWRFSPSIVYTLCSLVFAACAVLFLMGKSDTPQKTPTDKTSLSAATQTSTPVSKSAQTTSEQATPSTARQSAATQSPPVHPTQPESGSSPSGAAEPKDKK